MMHLISRLLGVGVLACASIAASAAPNPSPWTSLLVFGDSLADPGNAAALTGFAFPGTLDGHFSNGPTAAEVLAAKLYVPSVGGWPNATGASNFAVGGAMSGAGNFNSIANSPAGLPAIVGSTGMANQIARYTPSATDGSKPLYYLQGGANDFFLGFAQAQAIVGGGGTLPADFFGNIAASVVTNIAGDISSLVAKGAKTIIVANLPDLGLTPFALGTGASFAAQATALSNGYNNALAGAVAQIDGQLGAGYNIVIADTAGFTRDAANGVYSQITNVTGTWLGCMQAAAGNCDSYLFWDSVHPTALGHQLFAETLYTTALAAAVPEPETWVLMFAGLGLVAWRARRATPTYSAGTAHPPRTAHS